MKIERNTEIDLFIALAYEVLRSSKPGGGRYDNLHTVYSGYNSTFRLLFPGIDPVEYSQFLAGEGFIQLYPAKGGAFIRPLASFISEAQKGQEELGVRLLKYPEGLMAAKNGTIKNSAKPDLGKRLEELGF